LGPPSDLTPVKNDQSASSHQEHHIMISYCWAQKERMRKIADHLKSKGLSIWIDIERMEGSVLEAMARAVENSSIVIIGVSSQYKESHACRTEAEYAYKLQKRTICLMAEDDYVPRGWLGALLGNKLWYSCWDKDNNLKLDAVESVIRHIHNTFAEIKAEDIRHMPKNVAQAEKIGEKTEKRGKRGKDDEEEKDQKGSKRRKNTPNTEGNNLINLIDINPADLNTKGSTELNEGDVSLWKIDEVCSWLNANQLSAFLAFFRENQVHGNTLKFLHKERDKESFWKFFEDFEGKSSDILRFKEALNHLTQPVNRETLLKWSPEKVVQWLQSQDLSEIAELAKKDNWKGSALCGLLTASEKGNGLYTEFARELGIKNVLNQLSLLAALDTLKN